MPLFSFTVALLVGALNIHAATWNFLDACSYACKSAKASGSLSASVAAVTEISKCGNMKYNKPLQTRKQVENLLARSIEELHVHLTNENPTKNQEAILGLIAESSDGWKSLKLAFLMSYIAINQISVTDLGQIIQAYRGTFSTTFSGKHVGYAGVLIELLGRKDVTEKMLGTSYEKFVIDLFDSDLLGESYSSDVPHIAILNENLFRLYLINPTLAEKLEPLIISSIIKRGFPSASSIGWFSFDLSQALASRTFIFKEPPKNRKELQTLIQFTWNAAKKEKRVEEIREHLERAAKLALVEIEW